MRRAWQQWARRNLFVPGYPLPVLFWGLREQRAESPHPSISVPCPSAYPLCFPGFVWMEAQLIAKPRPTEDQAVTGSKLGAMLGHSLGLGSHPEYRSVHTAASWGPVHSSPLLSIPTPTPAPDPRQPTVCVREVSPHNHSQMFPNVAPQIQKSM